MMDNPLTETIARNEAFCLIANFNPTIIYEWRMYNYSEAALTTPSDSGSKQEYINSDTCNSQSV
jgi:hypothetical protein